MLVGASQVDITPKLPFFLAGSAKQRVSERILDPLYASSVAIKNGNTSVILISCDLANIKEEVVKAIRERVNKLIDVPPTNIIIAATHTHQGPKTGMNLPAPWLKMEQDTIDKMAEKIADSAVMAYSNKRPAKMGFGKGHIEKCSFNRRYIMSNGMSGYASRDMDPNGRIMPEGPVDKQVQVVWFEDMNGRYIAVIANYSCHPTSMFCTELVSADFPGVMRRIVQGAIGENVPVLYLQGACGNINTVDIEDVRTICENIEGMERIGRVLGGEVLVLISQSNAVENDEVSINSEIIQVPMRKISKKELEEAKQLWAQFSEKEIEGAKQRLARHCRDDEKLLPQRRLLYHAFSTIVLSEAAEKSPTCALELTALRLGDIVIITNPAELFVEYQLELKSRFNVINIIVSELTNGSAGYIPTRLAFALGGYESDRALQSKLDKEAGKLILESSTKLISEVTGINLREERMRIL